MSNPTVNDLAQHYLGRCIRIRRRIHQHPELAFEEHQTARMVCATLRSLGLEPECGVAGTGVVALLKGAAPGRTVLLRADMDALPIHEQVDLPYRSQVPNRMHACGHDGHVAGLLGAAMVLGDLRSRLKGQVKLVFQPAEESGGGAARMIEQGILDNPAVDAAFGCHLWGRLPEGQVQVRPGPMMAAPDLFRFRIQGVGGHGSAPHLAVDPILLGVQAISFMQAIVSRRIDPVEPAVLSICSLHAGDSENVIPEFLEAGGTVRTFDDALRDFIARRWRRSSRE